MTAQSIKNIEIFIVVEVPHQGPATVWSRTDADEVIRLICGDKWDIEQTDDGKFYGHDKVNGSDLGECETALEAAEMIVGDDGQHGAILTAEHALEYIKTGRWDVGHLIGKELHPRIETEAFRRRMDVQQALCEIYELTTVTGDADVSDQMILDEVQNTIGLVSQLLDQLSGDADLDDVEIDLEDLLKKAREKMEG